MDTSGLFILIWIGSVAIGYGLGRWLKSYLSKH